MSVPAGVPGQTHGPYQHGGGFPAVNGPANVQLFQPYTPPTFSQVATGLQLPSLFTSETGASVWSSFESMSATLSPEFWGLHGGTAPDVCNNSEWPSYVCVPAGCICVCLPGVFVCAVCVQCVCSVCLPGVFTCAVCVQCVCVQGVGARKPRV